MKKRIPSVNSIQKSDKSIPIAVQLEIKKDRAQKHKHHLHCPLPKPIKKDSSRHKHITEQLISIKQLKTPILNELRHLICNLINSSDRITQFLKQQEHKCSSQIYFEDRKKLIEYLNSLIVRPVHINQAQNQSSLKTQEIQGTYYHSQLPHIPLNKTFEGCLAEEVKEIKQKINGAIDRKRSKSSFTDLQRYLEKQVTVVKDKIDSLQKKNTQTNNEEFSSFITLYNKLNALNKKPIIPNNPQSSEHFGGETESLRCKIAEEERKNGQLQFEVTRLKGEVERMKSILVYLQLLLFKCEQILQEDFQINEQNQHLYVIQKQKITMVLNTLKSTYEYLHEQTETTVSNVTFKLKQQAQSMIIHLGQLRRKSLTLLQQKQKTLQLLREEKQNYSKEEQYCQELKLKVNRLNNDMSDLIQEIDKKDELTEYLKIENNNIKEDLRNMQDFIKQTKQNYNTLAFQLQQAIQKIKHLQSLLQAKEEQINQLLSQLQNKNKEIVLRLEQLQSKDEDITLFKQQYSKNQQSRVKLINTLTEQKKLITFQKQKKQNQLKQAEGKLKFLQEQSCILEKKIESVFNGEQEYKYKIQTLEQKIHSLQTQNEQLYRDIKQYENNQQSSLQTTIHISQLYKQLQQECIQLRDELTGDKKKITFYQQKVVQLAELADPAYYQKIIENYQKTISKLNAKLKQYQHQHIIIEQSIQELAQSESPSEKQQDQNNKMSQIQAPLDIQIHLPTNKQPIEPNYIPFLMQGQRLELHEEINAHLRDVPQQPSYISALSHYDIVVTNQNLDTIDVHKAIYPKTTTLIQEQQLQQNTLRPLNSIQQRDISNFADISQSDDQIQQKVLHEDYVHIKNENYQKQDQKSDKLSNVSKNVNVDQEASHKIVDFEEDDFIQQPSTTKNLKKVDDLLMQQQKGNQTNEIKSSKLLFKNVNQQQQLQAQIRFSGQRDIPSIVNRHTRTQNQPNVNDSPQSKYTTNRSNVYIRIRKQSLHLNQMSQKPYRSSSCYNQQI